MKPSNFKEANKTLQKPAGMTEEQCSPLPIWNDGKNCISLWRLGWKERFSVLIFGRIWLCILSGETQPPVWLDASRSVFIKPKGKVKNFVLNFFAGFKQKDKKLHLAAGFGIAFLLSFFSPLFGIIAAITAGAGKKVYDKVSKKGTPELLDFIFTVLGGLIGVGLYCLGLLFFKF